METPRIFRLFKTIKTNIRYFHRYFPATSYLEGKVAVKCLNRYGKLSIGPHFHACDQCQLAFGGSLSIGKNVFLNRNVSITALSNIKINDNVTIGNNVVLVDHDHGKRGSPFDCKPIVIGENVWIGANCTILKGVSIGKNSVVGAGSVVTRDIPDGVVFVNQRTNLEFKRIK